MISRNIAAVALLVISGSVLSEADGPDFWRVDLVEPGNYLNIRKGPSIQFGVIGKIPHNAVELENQGCYPDFNASEWREFTEAEALVAMKLRWCRISVDGLSGWVHSKYLKE